MTPDYDFRECASILGKTLGELAPDSFQKQRREAAMALLRGIHDEAKRLGYTATGFKEEEVAVTITVSRFASAIASYNEPQGCILVGSNTQGVTMFERRVALDFDAALGIFVGRTDDEFSARSPGQPAAKRSAAAAVAEELAQLLRQLSLTKK
jgi:hypothetical protein